MYQSHPQTRKVPGDKKNQTSFGEEESVQGCKTNKLNLNAYILTLGTISVSLHQWFSCLGCISESHRGHEKMKISGSHPQSF